MACRIDLGGVVGNEHEKVDRSELMKFLVSHTMKSGRYPAGDEEFLENFKQWSDMNLFYIKGEVEEGKGNRKFLKKFK